MMENEKFQEFIVDQFAKLFREFSGLKDDVQELKDDVQVIKGDVQELKNDVQVIKGDVQELKDIQLRIENKFSEQITSLHDFRLSQDHANQNNIDDHTTFGTKIEELQLEARITDGKLDEIAEDVSYLAKKSFRQERQIAKINNL